LDISLSNLVKHRGYGTTMNCSLSWSLLISSWLLFYWSVGCSRAFIVPMLTPHSSCRGTRNNNALAAAPGVQVDSDQAIREALQNPSTTIVDARSLEELQSTGFFRATTPGTTVTTRWVHAPATKVDAPLLELAATTLIPDLNAPVVVYCALGFRAATSQRVLQQAGYTNVLNAGGLDDLNRIMQRQ
jgi:phage shock protein E